MSDTVKLVIEISAETYEYWQTHADEYVLAEAIKNGTPLSEVLDEIREEILDYNIRQRVSGSENFLLGYCAGMDKSAEIVDKHISREGDK